jgi:hypothetical protein
MVALVMADAVLERFGGDSVDELCRRYADWQRQAEQRYARPRESGTS